MVKKWKAKRWFDTDKWVVVKGSIRFSHKKNDERKVVMFKSRPSATRFADNLNK